jgi:hypothetical protein
MNAFGHGPRDRVSEMLGTAGRGAAGRQTGGPRDRGPQLPEDPAGRFWQASARRLAREINLGWWVADWLPWAFAVGGGGIVAVLLARMQAAADGAAGSASGDAVRRVWWVIAAAAVATGIAAWWRARRRFETPATARVRLEEALGLDARLTAAAAGVGRWPERPERIRWPVEWRWRRPAGLLAGLAALLVVAARVPIAGAGGVRRHAIEKPTDVRLVEEWVERLRETELVDERAAREIDRRIEELLERPRENWFEHASLEAAGSLKERTAADLRELAGNLAKAERAAAALEAASAGLPADVRAALAREFAAGKLGLEAGGLEPGSRLAELLRELDAADLAALTPEEWAAIADRLAANRALLREALAKCKGFDLGECEGWCEECADAEPCGACEGCKDGKDCRKACKTCGRSRTARPGRGGVNRGRGDAELAFGQKNDLGTQAVEKLAGRLDPTRAAPDEVLAVIDGDHEVDRTAYEGPRAGGAVADAGDGGSAARVDALLPREQAAVRRFFE